jgi:SEC-C motif-containing protein
MSVSAELCPCGSKKTFIECCQPLLNGEQTATTPEQLMRSRFTAFYRADAWGYILNTWHPDHRPTVSDAELAAESRLAKWEKLEIRDTKMDGDLGEVTFCAWYRDQKGLHPHIERSQFVRWQGEWVYTQGEFLPYSRAVKIKPNDTCPCGSGKKYKRCCG